MDSMIEASIRQKCKYTILVLSAPIAKRTLPDGTRVFPSMIACRIKQKGTDLWRFDARLCVHGVSALHSFSDFAAHYLISLFG